jgi:hypothetical protein
LDHPSDELSSNEDRRPADRVRGRWNDVTKPAVGDYVEGLIMWSAAVVVDINAGQALRLGDGFDIIRAV